MISLQQIHPILVHFPIVFFLTLAVFDITAAWRGSAITGRSAVANVSTALALLAGGFAVLTYFFGDMALEIAEGSGFSSPIGEIHEALGTTTAMSLAVWAGIRCFLWWRDIRVGTAFARTIQAIELAGTGLVLATAYYGGQLVYDLGVNVAHAAG